jgi:hypothetical protein
MKRLAFSLCLAACLLAQTGLTVPHTLADLVGDGSVHAVSATALQVKTADLTAPSGNSGICRIGGASISIASQGQIIAPGGSYHFGALPAVVSAADIQKRDLNQIYYACASGDKLAVQYEQ